MRNIGDTILAVGQKAISASAFKSPHIVHVPRDYLVTHFGLTTTQVTHFYSSIRKHVKSRTSPIIGWDGARKLVIGSNSEVLGEVQRLLNQQPVNTEAQVGALSKIDQRSKEIGFSGTSQRDKAAKAYLSKLKSATSAANKDLGITIQHSTVLRAAKKGFGINSDIVLSIPTNAELQEGILDKAAEVTSAALSKEFADLEAQYGRRTAISALNAVLDSAFQGTRFSYTDKQTGNSKTSSRVTTLPLLNSVAGGASASIQVPKLKQLLNSALPAVIRSNMGNPEDPAKPGPLRNQTGRFSESWEITDIQAVGGKRVHIGYGLDSGVWRNYGTFFREGGKLYTPQRSPKRIVSTSIKELAQSILSNQFRVVSKYRGTI